MAQGHVYILRHTTSVSTQISVLQVLTVAGFRAEVLRAWATQTGSTTSAQPHIALRRKTAAATVTAAVDGTHIFRPDPAAPAPSSFFTLSTTGTGVIATNEGTDGNLILPMGFNVLQGWHYIPVPEERIVIPSAGILAMQFQAAPAVQTWQFGLVLRVL